MISRPWWLKCREVLDFQLIPWGPVAVQLWSVFKGNGVHKSTIQRFTCFPLVGDICEATKALLNTPNQVQGVQNDSTQKNKHVTSHQRLQK